jgi:MoaD family protein
MSIKVRLHPYLRKFVDSQSVVEVSGHTVEECIDSLDSRYPGIKQQLLNEQGKLRDYYDVCVNLQSSQADPLSEPIHDGDELLIITVIAGG